MNARLPLLLICLTLVACRSPRGASVPAEADEPVPSAEELEASGVVPAPAVQQPTQVAAPGPPEGDTADWIRLVSGEWLKGEFQALNKDAVEFESEELDDLTFDWDDIYELRATRSFTAMFADRSTQAGVPHVTRRTVTMTNEAGQFEYPRSRLMRLIPGRPEDRANWSGSIGISSTARTGNTEQTDSGLTAKARRRTAGSRTTLELDALVSTIDEQKTANNRSFTGRHDVYLSPKFFITPIALDLFRDRFQNISLRATPSAGVGYTFVDRSLVEWDGLASLGYRYTEFTSVAAGESDDDGSAALILSTDLRTDLTKRAELIFDYTIQVGLEESSDADQDMTLTLSLDFAWDLDIDIRVGWKRIGNPEPDQSGTTPEQDDFRLDVGLSWEF